LKATLPDLTGVVVEDKGYSLTVHYRGAADRMAARAAILEAAEQLADVRIVGGSEAINLLRRDAPDKGSALAYAVRAFACNTAIYIGDDDTDEDAFAALPPDRLLSIRIGGAPTCSGARFHLRSQQEIDTFMDRLLLLRREGRKGQPRESFEFTP
jgi:trehalose 6-phosphate phosphatase